MDAGVDRKPKILSSEQAAGPLRAHTLGVNEWGSASCRRRASVVTISRPLLAARGRPSHKPRPRGQRLGITRVMPHAECEVAKRKTFAVADEAEDHADLAVRSLACWPL